MIRRFRSSWLAVTLFGWVLAVLTLVPVAGAAELPPEVSDRIDAARRKHAELVERNESLGPEGSRIGTVLPLVPESLDRIESSGEWDPFLDRVELTLSVVGKEIFERELPMMASPRVETRAVWHRLRETTEADIVTLADDLQRTGINVLLVETVFGSRSLYEDPTGLYQRFGQYGDIDPMAVLIEACHARGIEVHAWVHCFFIGIEGNASEAPLLAASHPEWLEKMRDGGSVSRIEPGYRYLSPAIPEVRAAMIASYKALASDYDIDGIQLDYIRWCASDALDNHWGYSEATREAARADLGFDPLQIAPETHANEWAAWLRWREEVITSFVREAVGELRAANAELVLSADVFPGIDETLPTKGQNWMAWAEEGLLDALFPMIYVRSAEAVESQTGQVDEGAPGGVWIVAGLGPYLDLTREEIVAQIGAAREARADGVALFAWDTLNPEEKEALALGPFRVAAEPAWRAGLTKPGPEDVQ